MVTGKTSPLLGASAALLLNALKHMAGIDHKLDLIPSSVIEPISAMKTGYLGHPNPRLHSDEVLIALAISGLTNPLAAMVQEQLKTLRGLRRPLLRHYLRRRTPSSISGWVSTSAASRNTRSSPCTTKSDPHFARCASKRRSLSTSAVF